MVFGFTAPDTDLVLGDASTGGDASTQIDERYAKLEIHLGYFAEIGSKTLIEMEQISSEREDHEVNLHENSFPWMHRQAEGRDPYFYTIKDPSLYNLVDSVESQNG